MIGGASWCDVEGVSHELLTLGLVLHDMAVLVRAEHWDDITYQTRILTSALQHPDTHRLWVFAL